MGRFIVTTDLDRGESEKARSVCILIFSAKDWPFHFDADVIHWTGMSVPRKATASQMAGLCRAATWLADHPRPEWLKHSQGLTLEEVSSDLRNTATWATLESEALIGAQALVDSVYR